MSSSSLTLTPFQREVVSRFGLVPNFFVSAPEAPEIVERLWAFAVSAYFDNPIPSLFKERLFVYLSRFCEVRYCIIRHCAFLLGYGHSAGDPKAPRQTVEQVIRLLTRPTPWERGPDTVAAALEGSPPCIEWPEPESELEDKLFSALTLVFVEARRSERAGKALRHALGGRRYEHVLGLLAFIRTAHFWTVLHPDLPLEDDAQEMLKINKELTQRLLYDQEAARCEMGQRLFAELEDLRALNERRDLERAKRALEAEVAQKELLLKEVNHRIKNSLQIVASILHLQRGHVQNAEAHAALQDASARVRAIAAVHERLYAGKDIRTVPLGAFLASLCSNIGDALGRADAVRVDPASVEVPTDVAIPLALIVNELLTNALKYGRAPYHVVLKAPEGRLVLAISDAGPGPAKDERRKGLGSQIVEALTRQLAATIETFHRAEGYLVQLTVPLHASAKHEGPDRRG
jgi:two-component sensor histidine kinase